MFSYGITGLFFKCSVFLHFKALVAPSVRKDLPQRTILSAPSFSSQSFCTFSHYNLVSPIPSALVILFKSQPTTQHTLSPFLPCLLLVFVSVFLLCFVFITHLSDRARGLSPEWALHKHVQICWINPTVSSAHSRCSLFFNQQHEPPNYILHQKGVHRFFPFHEFFQLTKIESGCISETGVFHLYIVKH